MKHLKTTFADRVNHFNKELSLDANLPEHIEVLQPFRDAGVFKTAAAFYNKYYNDNNERVLIMGINPGRLGGGSTGVPFTDPKRLAERCGIAFEGRTTHEPSSAFIYDMIDAYGSIDAFYDRFYITSVCPLGFIKKDEQGREKNYNYFDSAALQRAVGPFIEWNIKQQIAIGCSTEVCYCLGSSKNYAYLLELNKHKRFFKQVIPLEHPRFIMQYRAREKDRYIQDYLQKLAPFAAR